ncbi:MAG: serine acetyltransferase [Fimbriimonadaceae bacterium]|nr:serine acetyltransferase [Fimbriimonadaceae bacterium]
MPSPEPATARALADRRTRRCFPVGIRRDAARIANESLGLLFPHFSHETDCDESNLQNHLDNLEHTLRRVHAAVADPQGEPDPVAPFLGSLPAIHDALDLDARAIAEGDPAASGVDEVILTYPGFYAIGVYRLAHALHRLGYPLLPRLMSEYAHRETGIDIHPGATIGRSFFIDHGTGLVIGETASIGNGVKLYQGVTLGALQVRKGLAARKRHPTLGDNVVVYANATILGGETTIGHDSIVAGNAWVTESVPPFSIVGRHSDVRPRRPGEDADLEFHI